MSKYGVFSGPYFPAFGLNTERYCISPHSVRMRENTDQKNSVFGHYSRSDILEKNSNRLRKICFIMSGIINNPKYLRGCASARVS